MCEYCNIGDNDEYRPDSELPFKVLIDGRKQHFEILVEEDPDYNHYILVDGTFLKVHIPINNCPMCGRLL